MNGAQSNPPAPPRRSPRSRASSTQRWLAAALAWPLAAWLALSVAHGAAQGARSGVRADAGYDVLVREALAEYGLGNFAEARALAGSIYVAGQTEGQLDDQPNRGSYDVFLAKYDATGTRLWTRQFGAVANDGASGCAVDRDGSIYVTGTTFGDLASSTVFAEGDPFLAKYDANGVQLWLEQLGSTTDDAAEALTTDPDGNTYIAGTIKGALDGNEHNGGIDMFVLKYDPDGNRL
jgi:catechol 2,3-dioxygenase-like lactoylglutathione lyase family enzyme